MLAVRTHAQKTFKWWLRFFLMLLWWNWQHLKSVTLTARFIASTLCTRSNDRNQMPDSAFVGTTSRVNRSISLRVLNELSSMHTQHGRSPSVKASARSVQCERRNNYTAFFCRFLMQLISLCSQFIPNHISFFTILQNEFSVSRSSSNIHFTKNDCGVVTVITN